MIDTPLKCAEFDTTLEYMIPDLGNKTSLVANLNMRCTETSSLLIYQADLDSKDWLSHLTIENAHYYRLNIALKSQVSLGSNYTKLYLGYSGSDVLYSGLNIERN